MTCLGASRTDWLVALDGEGRRGDGIIATIAAEAIAMPFGIQSDNGAIGDRFLALGATASEHILEILLAVDLAVALVERTIRQRFLAGTITDKAGLVPIGAQGTDGTLQNGLFAAGTGACVALHETFAANRFTILDIKGRVLDLLLAMAAQEMLRMPGLAKGSDYALGDGLIALVAYVVLLLAHFCNFFSVIFYLFRMVGCRLYFSCIFSLFSKTRTRARVAPGTHRN